MAAFLFSFHNAPNKIHIQLESRLPATKHNLQQPFKSLLRLRITSRYPPWTPSDPGNRVSHRRTPCEAIPAPQLPNTISDRTVQTLLHTHIHVLHTTTNTAFPSQPALKAPLAPTIPATNPFPTLPTYKPAPAPPILAAHRRQHLTELNPQRSPNPIYAFTQAASAPSLAHMISNDI